MPWFHAFKALHTLHFKSHSLNLCHGFMRSKCFIHFIHVRHSLNLHYISSDTVWTYAMVSCVQSASYITFQVTHSKPMPWFHAFKALHTLHTLHFKRHSLNLCHGFMRSKHFKRHSLNLCHGFMRSKRFIHYISSDTV